MRGGGGGASSIVHALIISIGQGEGGFFPWSPTTEKTHQEASLNFAAHVVLLGSCLCQSSLSQQWHFWIKLSRPAKSQHSTYPFNRQNNKYAPT